MDNVPENIKRIIQEFVSGVNKILGDRVKKVILYGSYARGEQDLDGEISDIDIMILVDLDEEAIKETEKSIFDFTYDINLKYDVLISPIIENIENYECRKEYIVFYKNVAKEGVILNG